MASICTSTGLVGSTYNIEHGSAISYAESAYDYINMYAIEAINLPTLALYFVTGLFTLSSVFFRLGYMF